MKKIIAVAAVLALAGTQLQTARAGECEWATAGKVLAGVAIGAAVVSAVNAPAGHSAVSVSYGGPGVSFGYGYNAGPPTVACAPAPVVYAPAPVVCAPRAVAVCAPAPVVVYRPPVVYAPVVYAPPVVAVRYGHGYGYRHGHGPHGRW